MLHYGKTPATYDPRDALYADHRPTLLRTGQLPAIPARFGHGNDFTGEGWLMLGNGPDDTVTPGFQGCGDCAWAGPAHEIMELNQNAGRPVPRFTGRTVVDQYAEYSGYNLATGENDTGSNVRDVLNWRRTKGYRDSDGGVHKIGMFVALEPRNLQHLLEACFLFECVGIGIEVPASVPQQFAEGRPWSVTAAPIESGHYIPVVGRPDTGHVAAVSWARRVVLTDAFYERYCDEAWAYITPEEFSRKTGKTYEGYSPEALASYLNTI